MKHKPTAKPHTLWSPRAVPDPQMMAYTVGDDRTWDARLITWDILGSLGHIEGLRAAALLSSQEYAQLCAGLRAALAAARAGKLVIGPEHEDVHSAVEDWLTRHLGPVGERVHAGRSRNDQVTVDLRLYLKDALLGRHTAALDLCAALLQFAARHRDALWPGFTHQRRAMPSSAGLWAAGLAEGVLTSAECLKGLWSRVDRSPLGSAAGYGVPLPIEREVAMRSLGFQALDHIVTSVQLSRGKLETAVLAWCVDLAHDLGRLAADVVLLSSDEYGFLILPSELTTGSSIMPHKRNPDLFELTRARAAALDGDLVTLLTLKSKLTSGYHRDFQLFKEPLFRGLDRAAEMLHMLTHALPLISVDRERGSAALGGDVLATDEVMRRVEAGTAFRQAYRDVATALKRGENFPSPSIAEITRRRRGTGNLGNLRLDVLRKRVVSERTWNRQQRRRFERALAHLTAADRRGGEV